MVKYVMIAQRIYGTAWTSSTDLIEFKSRQNEARLRDHRLIGQQLDLFSIQVLAFR